MHSDGVTAHAGSQTYSMTLTSLEPGTQYFYRIESSHMLEIRTSVEYTFQTEDDSKAIFFYYIITLFLQDLAESLTYDPVLQMMPPWSSPGMPLLSLMVQFSATLCSFPTLMMAAL